MSHPVTVGSVVRSEWLKFRTVRSNMIAISLVFVLTIGIGALVAIMLRGDWSTTGSIQQLMFNPVATSLVGVTFAQFAVGVLGSLFITNEYSSGAIRTTLTAAPRRIRLVLGKLIVLVSTVLAVSEVACFISFLLGQSILAGVAPTVSLGGAGVLRSVVLGGVYLALLAVLAFALGLLLRHSAAAISVFVSVLLVVPLILVILPSGLQNTVGKFLPSELGSAMISVVTPAHDFSAFGSLGVLAAYAGVLLGIAMLAMTRRDA